MFGALASQKYVNSNVLEQLWPKQLLNTDQEIGNQDSCMIQTVDESITGILKDSGDTKDPWKRSTFVTESPA